jgi:HAMP domain-containing protein
MQGLNVNKGQKVLLRLRPAHALDSFHTWHDILGTMLHEVRAAAWVSDALACPRAAVVHVTRRTIPPVPRAHKLNNMRTTHTRAQLVHNEISAHNRQFYALLDELWAEAEALMDAGISGSGQGFDAPSVGRLGSYGWLPTHNPPAHKMTDAMRKVGVAAWPCPWGGGARAAHGALCA